MSAYIVGDKTINRIINFLFWNRDINKSCLKDILSKLNLSFENDKEMQKLGKSLITLNCQAVSQRYTEDIDKKLIKEYKFKDIKVDRIQALKSLQCFLYQCLEGDIPNTKLYKALRDIETSIIHSIINDLEEYDKAECG